jgi:hypothetical protein
MNPMDAYIDEAGLGSEYRAGENGLKELQAALQATCDARNLDYTIRLSSAFNGVGLTAGEDWPDDSDLQRAYEDTLEAMPAEWNTARD